MKANGNYFAGVVRRGADAVAEGLELKPVSGPVKNGRDSHHLRHFAHRGQGRHVCRFRPIQRSAAFDPGPIAASL